MAVLCSSTPSTPLKKPWPIAKPVNNVWMLQTRRRKLCAKLQIRSSMKNKVYEDLSEGVICYTNEDGETICEGYDEGPRYCREIILNTATRLPRDAEMSDLVLLQRCWLQIVKGEELNHASKGGVALKVNGSNTPC